MALLASAVVGLVAACNDVPSPTGVTIDEAPSLAAVQIAAVVRPAWSLDSKFERIAGQVPGFAGLYFDRVGNLQVNVTNTNSTLATIRSAILAEMGEGFLSSWSPGAAEAVIRVNVVEYSTAELLEAYDAARSTIWAVEGHKTADVDEVANRIWLGVDPGSANAMTSALIRSGADLAMFTVEETITPLQPLNNHTLQSDFDSLLGSIQIERFGGGECTATFATEYSIGTPGWVTASHCTTDTFDYDGVTMYQADYHGWAPWLRDWGTESIDPDPFTTGCSDSDGCRYSDSAMIEADEPIKLGYIMNTVTRGDPYELDTDEAMEIGMEGSGCPAVGTTVDKIGRTSGWTYGHVFRSCYDHDTSPSPSWGGVTILNTTEVHGAWAQGGPTTQLCGVARARRPYTTGRKMRLQIHGI